MVDINDRRNKSETSYHQSTPVGVRRILESHMGSRDSRLTVHYGDPETGAAWGDSETGYVGRSSGDVKVPLVVHNLRSSGGGAMLDKNIVKIEAARKSRDGSRPVLWQHPNYTDPS